MITRDVSLEDCILDLIDNSVDSAWTSEDSPDMAFDDNTDLSAYTISITATPERFEITDNCRGMSLQEAIDHAFTFGRPKTRCHDAYSIGVYGIGMKRAAFKIGTNIQVTSTYQTPQEDFQSFIVSIHVAAWLQDGELPWTFPIQAADSLGNPGVTIAIPELTPEAHDAFQDKRFLENLHRTIHRDYMLHLNRGLNIILNGYPVEPLDLTLRLGDDFKPIRLQYSDASIREVQVEIIAGMAAEPIDDSSPVENSRGDRRYGWYIACNGRMVLAGDKTHISGWGTERWPQWHQQYAGFLGVAHFTSPNANDLPLTTTKRNVDAASEVFRHARTRMRDISTQWIRYTNERKRDLDRSRQREQATEPVRLYDVQEHTEVTLPDLPRENYVPQANVHYSVPRKRMRALAAGLGDINMTYRDVGLKSFEYTYDEFAGED